MNTEETGYRRAGLALGGLTVVSAGVLAAVGILGPMGVEGLLLVGWAVAHVTGVSNRNGNTSRLCLTEGACDEL